MLQAKLPCFLSHFSALRDLRQAPKMLHPLAEILLLILCATIVGADDFVEITLWGNEHLAVLRRFPPDEKNIPSHDTLCDVIAAINPDLFKTCFLAWVEGLREDTPEVIAIDGKTSRRSHARGKGRLPLHTVSAWATQQRLVLGQEAVAEKANEILAIPLLLRRLELTGRVGNDRCDGIPEGDCSDHPRRRRRLCPGAQGKLAGNLCRSRESLCRPAAPA